MWACVLLTDAEAGDPVTFSSVTILPVRDTMRVVDVLGSLSRHDVLIAAAQSLADELMIASTLAVGRWPHLRAARLVSSHAPLAILSALALARSTTDEATTGIPLARRLLDYTWSGAWTRSVSKLTRPAPKLSQHARSLLPGGGFVVRQHPDPVVLPASGDSGIQPIGVERLLLVEDGVVPTALTQRLTAQAGAVAVRQVSLPGHWTSVYGGGGTGQIALVPTEAQRFVAPPTHRCPSCWMEQSSEICPFCHVVGLPTAFALEGGIV